MNPLLPSPAALPCCPAGQGGEAGTAHQQLRQGCAPLLLPPLLHCCRRCSCAAAGPARLHCCCRRCCFVLHATGLAAAGEGIPPACAEHWLSWLGCIYQAPSTRHPTTASPLPLLPAGIIPLCREKQAGEVGSWLRRQMATGRGGSMYLSGPPGTGVGRVSSWDGCWDGAAAAPTAGVIVRGEAAPAIPCHLHHHHPPFSSFPSPHTHHHPPSFSSSPSPQASRSPCTRWCASAGAPPRLPAAPQRSSSSRRRQSSRRGGSRARCRPRPSSPSIA